MHQGPERGGRPDEKEPAAADGRQAVLDREGALLEAHAGEADPYLSASRFKRFVRCPLSYAIVYRAGNRPPPTKWAIRGKIVHEAMRIAGERGGPYAHAEMLRDAVQAAMADEPGGQPTAWRDAVGMASEVILTTTPRFYRIASGALLEERVVAEFDAPGGPFAVLSYMDAVVAAGPGSCDIYDWKTDANPNPSDHSLQAAVYRATWEAARGGSSSFSVAYFSSGVVFRLSTPERKEVERAMARIVSEIRAERWRPNFASCRKPWPCDTLALCPYKGGS